MMLVSHILGLLGQFAIGLALLVLASLSQKLGQITHVRPYFICHYIAAGLIWAGLLVRLYLIMQGTEALRTSSRTVLYTLITDGLPAIGVTLGLVVTWFYWSWLLAERD
ncbi:MAG: hypothetical protein Q9P01_09080 [Anaerolineae bacterium]|nr:hypothetical protein [Anaerolineae bacterium]MDQ7034970.1 hypothetical protein [Anaerolineae bacterium]